MAGEQSQLSAYISKWKAQMQSKETKTHVIAMLEIVEMFSKLTNETASSINIVLINSDICYFLAECMSYNRKTTLSLINKIVCHLSEAAIFFKNDIFRILRGLFTFQCLKGLKFYFYRLFSSR